MRRLIGNTLAAAAVMTAPACAVSEPAENPYAHFPASDLRYLPNNRLWDGDKNCYVDMRYVIDPQTGQVTEFTDPDLYKDRPDYGIDEQYCSPDTTFPPESFSAYHLQINRTAYHDFQANATKQLEKGTKPIQGKDEFHTFTDEQITWLPAIGRIGLTDDGKALKAQLYNGADGTPSVATSCYVSPLHSQEGELADSNRVLGHVMYHGETDTPYTLVQLGSDAASLQVISVPPLVNGPCEPGNVVAVRSETSVHS